MSAYLTIRILASFALVTGLLLGCATDTAIPRFVDEREVARIKLEQSTMEDVQALFGKPTQVQTISESDGNVTVWRYQYFQQGRYELVPFLRESLSRPAIRSMLEVRFGPDGRVKKVDRTHTEIRSPEEGGVLVPF